MPEPHRGFTATFHRREQPLLLLQNDPRLKQGVEEYTDVPQGTGKPESRGRGYINRFTEVIFYNGGNRNAWNKALEHLRQEYGGDESHSLAGAVTFDMDGSSVGSGFVILLANYSTARVEQSGPLVEPRSPQVPTKDLTVGTQFEPLRIEDYQRQPTSEIKVETTFDPFEFTRDDPWER